MSQKNNRLSPPLMFAFRAAHEAKDARRSVLALDRGAPRRGGGRVAVTEALLRREVSRDLELLMNSIALESTDNLEDFDQVRASILNYGLPDIAHRTIDEAKVGEIEGEIRRALELYEPRLDAGSIVVRRDDSVDGEMLRLRFLVDAQLVCQPINIPVEFVADVDFDSGEISVSRT
ncbi:type VI secretion system baseplate subunit TssE [Rhodoblastus acidophilus]|uniref:Type VI secretion system baseplate subunit TssE n=1 Tax=Candidatus Rhodoblastus alkanivorans TaxID=2954117 RepID=A0ABS9Z781_9HYPH|nr:type VI secretion system baseplate subunit TssE [Candidatus Rhodoblastus alkanivorans]MCI4678272.1 type VI secretion system baseplate subunit TssE [Candidatus Rhodoblastus alkanivorans]MCI4683530.1 type VI secretion system baseplate subunit TssE [Candidatus Rhodoblastus alkanivorans]MDI4640845.1 type VI secretion system baseplate subunit TssE [Rhodoblastus acidophilus]